jgi:hypothetical protein
MSKLTIPVRAAAVRHASANKSQQSKYHLQSIYRDSDGSYVATDGHMLLRAQVGANAEARQAIVAREGLDLELKVAKARKAEVVEVEPATNIEPDLFPNWRAVVPEPRSTVADAAGVEVEGTQGAYYRDELRVILDGRLLERVVKAAAEFHGRKPGQDVLLTFHFPTGVEQGRPVMVTCEKNSEADGHLTAVVMPCRG